MSLLARNVCHCPPAQKVALTQSHNRKRTAEAAGPVQVAVHMPVLRASVLTALI